MIHDLSDRRLGSYPEAHPPDLQGPQGPLLLVMGGIHGNEPAGVLAARTVIGELGRARPPFRGRLVALAGNLGALRTGRRFVERDLNRAWTDEELARLSAADRPLDRDEGREQRELLEAIEPLLAQKWERVVLLDLHSTSAEGSPFVIMGDTLQNRRVGFPLGVPVILGLEERVEGTLLSYFGELGHASVCLEGGQNERSTTIAHHEAALWITLVSCGMLAPKDVPRLAEKRELLRRAASGLPRVVEIRHREAVPADEPFAMRPGFANFDRIVKGTVLADVGPLERPRPLASPMQGLLLMPRYQGLGADAFFVGRRVRFYWLTLSAALRRLKLERVLARLPGVRGDPRQPRLLWVDGRIARVFTLEILHLFGYRKSGKEGPFQTFIRRRDAR